MLCKIVWNCILRAQNIGVQGLCEGNTTLSLVQRGMEKDFGQKILPIKSWQMDRIKAKNFVYLLRCCSALGKMEWEKFYDWLTLRGESNFSTFRRITRTSNSWKRTRFSFFTETFENFYPIILSFVFRRVNPEYFKRSSKKFMKFKLFLNLKAEEIVLWTLKLRIQVSFRILNFF